MFFELFLLEIELYFLEIQYLCVRISTKYIKRLELQVVSWPNVLS